MTHEKHFDWAKLLRRHPLFATLPEAEKDQSIEWFLSSEVSEEDDYAKGTIIITEGDFGDSVFLIGTGSVRVVLLDIDGKESAILGRLKSGDFFGEMALFEAKPRAATVIADEESTILEVKGQEFLNLMEEHPEIEFKILLKLSERLRCSNERFLAMKLKNVDEKLQAFNTRLEAELKVIDASLKASQAFFDQTKVRTDEVIDSAERSQTRLTFAASTIGGFVTVVVGLLGFFGVKQLSDLSAMVKDVTAQYEGVQQQSKEIAESKAAITSTETDVKGIAADLHTVLEQLHENVDTSLGYIAQNVIRPQLLEALNADLPETATPCYQDLQRLGLNKLELSKINKQALIYIEFKIANLSEQPPKDYTTLLYLINKDPGSAEVQFKSHYLLLANIILLNPEHPENAEVAIDQQTHKTFQQLFDSFKDYAESEKGTAISKRFDLSTLENCFDARKPPQKELFGRVKALIPTT